MSASEDCIQRIKQYRAFDEFPKNIQDALNYSNLGFSSKDIVYLHSLYVSGKKTAADIEIMIKKVDAFYTLFGPFYKGQITHLKIY